jgi:hypothetical protein
MATKTNFNDPALGNGVYAGDLKYGRCNGTTINKHHDYPADCNSDGKAVNHPAVPLVLAHQRDPSLWRNKTKKPNIKRNSQDFKDQIMMKLASQTGGLLHHIRVIKVDKQVSVIN